MLAVYTYTGVLTGYGDLFEIACNNDGGGIGTASSLNFAALGGHQYLVVIDGVQGARGIAHLNYQVDTLQLPVSPLIQPPPAEKLVTPGDTITLAVSVAGSPPLRYLWALGNTPIPHQTNAALVIENFQAADQGDYSVQVSSHIGATNSAPIHVSLQIPPPLALIQQGPDMLIRVFVPPGAQYQIQYKDSLESVEWLPSGNPFTGANRVQVFTASTATLTQRFYRLRP